MPLSISFELSDRDLEHFNNAIKAATFSAGSKSAEEVMAASGKLLESASSMELPDFIMERLDKLDALIAMLRDEGWQLPEEDRQRVLSALVYFADPQDIIPDNVPVLGYFDDAIAIELCVRELRHELDAYDEFCDFRQGESDRRGLSPSAVGRAEWLSSRRDELQDRMHRQRTRDVGTGYGNSSGYAREGYSNPWRPSLLRVR
ncbi:MAG: YkvA family protein [Arenimonas sp.]